ncbi:MAG TPA: HTTM domain-containing protein [Chitinophagales bacterium]|nr:HTTM domain-containing protein [Chitinophagales bacterium]HNM31934.1 HTTM domain-containing protein [Chitinophagales bacterium]
MQRLNYIQSKIEFLRLDERSVSLFRILLGISMLYSLIILKFPYTIQIWGEHPIIPVALMKKMNGAGAFSIFDWIRNDTFAYFWMLTAILLAFLYTIGFYTKWISFLLLFFFFNLLQAYARYNAGFDKYTFQLLTWSCFLPLSNFFAVKANPTKYKTQLWVSIILITQIACIYCATGFAKTGEAWKQGYAIKIMASDIWMNSSMAELFRNNAFIYTPLTYLTLIAEVAFPIFLFVPVKKDLFRYFAVVFLLVFHISILLITDVGNFSYTGIAAAGLLLPASFWEYFNIKHGIKYVQKKYSNRIRYLIFSGTALVLFTFIQKNLLFLATLQSHKNMQPTILYKAMKSIDIPRIAENSFQDQFWKMFAPEPSNQGGWISIEYIGDDGILYDLFSNTPISLTQHTLNFNPHGMEKILLSYGRMFKYKDKWFTAVFLKNWYFYQLKIRNIAPEKYKNYFLAEYNSNVVDAGNTITPITKQLYSSKAIEDLKIDIPKK